MFIYPYREGSHSVANLRAAMPELRVIRREKSAFRGNRNKIVINWGCSELPEEVMKAEIINKPEAVAIAANKKKFFDAVKGQVNIPEYTTDQTEALSWVEAGKVVLVRETLTGSGGEGIRILRTRSDWESYNHSRSKLYVKYIPKRDEYRIHVAGGEITDRQRKAIDPSLEGTQVNFQIRNRNNGFIFVRNDVQPPEQVEEQAKLAVEACGLDFGAVDIIWNDYRKTAYVLEVNTAPGIENTSVDNYAQAVRRLRDRYGDISMQPTLTTGTRVGGGGVGQTARAERPTLNTFFDDFGAGPLDSTEF